MSDHESKEPERVKAKDRHSNNRPERATGGPRVSAFDGQSKGVERLVGVYQEGAAHMSCLKRKQYIWHTTWLRSQSQNL